MCTHKVNLLCYSVINLAEKKQRYGPQLLQRDSIVDSRIATF